LREFKQLHLIYFFNKVFLIRLYRYTTAESQFWLVKFFEKISLESRSCFRRKFI
jgi:hypothetical protein